MDWDKRMGSINDGNDSPEAIGGEDSRFAGEDEIGEEIEIRGGITGEWDEELVILDNREGAEFGEIETANIEEAAMERGFSCDWREE